MLTITRWRKVSLQALSANSLTVVLGSPKRKHFMLSLHGLKLGITPSDGYIDGLASLSPM